ncbi:Brp/Blh family beta-carotene 15,15'-dioxygenase [Aquiflexum sp.]|uniref:Brp/Blh family beta-carotene 15,15'-dioxygenase n=1 Tax=Aquiflexum sp. TaxID=1872584 RepID=UPI003593B8E1
MENIETIGKILGLLIGIVFLVFFEGSETYQWIWFGIIMVTIGIPHGAIDHLLANPRMEKKNLYKFLSKYVLIIAAYLLVWYFFPKTALLLFILMSSFHFGQSHFINDRINNLKSLTYFSLGAFYLCVILWGDFETTAFILENTINLKDWENIGWFIIPVLFSLNTFLLLYIQEKKKVMIWTEMIVLGSVLYLVPLLLGFIIYFGFWHALPSMLIEYQTLKHHLAGNKIISFISSLLPFSLISLVGIAIILGVFSRRMEENELTLIFFILIALISAPHIWFMNIFLVAKKL